MCASIKNYPLIYNFTTVCCRTSISEEEMGVVMQMLLDAVRSDRKGLLLDTRGGGIEGVRWLVVCHAIYYITSHPSFARSLGKISEPLKVFEMMLLANHFRGNGLVRPSRVYHFSVGRAGEK